MAIDREAVLQAAQKYVERKKYDKAVLEYQKIIQVDPNDARTLLKIGDLQLKMEAYAEAISTYERVGKFYASQGFALKAIAVYKQIRDIIHRHVPQLEERYGQIAPKLAELYQQLGLTSDALAALDEVATRLQRQQRDNEALAVFRKIVELDPANPLPHLRLAEALSRARDNDGAATEFGTAAAQLLKHGRRDDALKVIERLLHHRQDVTQARIAAELYLARGQANDGLQALAKLQICFQANPKDLDTLALLARSFAAIGQASKGIEVHKEMARIAREQGRNDLFRELVEKLQRVAPNDSTVRQLAASPPVVRGTSISAAEEIGQDDLIEGSIPPEAHDAADATGFGEDDDQATGMTTAVTDDAPEMTVGDGGEYADDPAVSAAQIAEILEEAASLRRHQLYPKAIETLRLGVEIDPHVMELRVALRDILLETERHAEAVEEMLAIASIQLDGLDGEAAAQSLQEVLQIDPRNDRALHALRELGYDASAPSIDDDEPGYEAVDELVNSTSFDAYGTGEEPLPAYDLDDAGAETRFDHAPPSMPASNPFSGPLEQTMRETGPLFRGGRDDGLAARPSPTSGRSLDVMDDPFGAEGPLPSFPLDAQDGHDANGTFAHLPGLRDEDAFPVAPRVSPMLGITPPSSPALAAPSSPAFAPPSSPAFAAPSSPAFAPPSAPAFPPPSSSGPSAFMPRTSRWPTVELEDALEEAEFFASRGLFDDARAVLSEQLQRAPNHPLLRERMVELETQEQAAAQTSGTRAMPRFGDEEDRGTFDIATSLDALESLDNGGAPESAVGRQDQVDVEEVFAKFKEGVSKQISPDDAQMHYDLGIAYREIGKHTDAIREFEIAGRDARRACICESMIGMIHMEQGHVADAIDAFLRGLHAPARTPEQETVLSFELGTAYEAKKMFKDALTYYQRVSRREPNYRDVQERIRRLSKSGDAPKVRAAAVGADDEFDRAFEEIFGSEKLP